MEWILLSLLLLVLVVACLGLYLTVRHGLLIVEILQRLQTPPMHTEVSSQQEAAPALQEPGSTWLPTDQERQELEQRLLAESRQRAGFARSRRNSMRPTA